MQWEKGLKNLKLSLFATFFFGSLIPSLFLSLFLSPSLPGLVRFLYKGSINDKEILLQSRGIQLCYLEEIIYRS